MAYTTAFGLPQEVVDYLNQQLPDIDNIFSSTPPDPDPDPDPDTGAYPGITKPYWEDDYLPGTNPDPNSTRMPSKYDPYPSRRAEDYDPNLSGGMNMKHMEMYPDYYNRPVKNNPLEKGIGLLKNTSIGHGLGAAKGIVEGILPMNRTALLQNEMLGQGFAVDSTGRIVRVDQGDPDTAGNIMAGRNVSRMSEKTFQDRLDNLNMSEEGEKKRRAAIEAAREAWRRANVKTDAVYHDKYKDRPDYRMLDTKYEEWEKDQNWYNKSAKDKLAMTGSDQEWGDGFTNTGKIPTSTEEDSFEEFLILQEMKNKKEAQVKAAQVEAAQVEAATGDGIVDSGEKTSDSGHGSATAWTDSFSGGHDYGGGGEFDMPSNTDQGEQSSDSGWSDPPADDGYGVWVAQGGRVKDAPRRIGLFEGGDTDWDAIDTHAANVENIVSPGGSQQDYEDRYNQMVKSHGGPPQQSPSLENTLIGGAKTVGEFKYLRDLMTGNYPGMAKDIVGSFMLNKFKGRKTEEEEEEEEDRSNLPIGGFDNSGNFIGEGFNRGIESLYAFKPDSALDRELKFLNENPTLNPDRYNQLLKQDVEAWDPEKGGNPHIPLSLPANEYGNILYGAQGGRVGYSEGGLATLWPK